VLIFSNHPISQYELDSKMFNSCIASYWSIVYMDH